MTTPDRLARLLNLLPGAVVVGGVAVFAFGGGCGGSAGVATADGTITQGLEECYGADLEEIPCECAPPAGFTAVSTPADVAAIAWAPAGKYYLCNDIDFGNANVADAVVPTFSGTLQGNYRALRNVNITQGNAQRAGVFGFVSGTIENVVLDDVVVVGADRVGGLAGVTSGATLRNITLRAVTLRPSSYSSRELGLLAGYLGGGTVDGGTVESTSKIENWTHGLSLSAAGGLAGTAGASAVIRNVSSDATVLALMGNGTFSYNTNIGGLVGQCFNCTVEDVRVGGVAIGDYDVGGLIGMADGATVRRADVAVDVTANYGRAGGVIGVTGLNVAVLIEESRFVGSLAGAYRSAGVIGEVRKATTLRGIVVDATIWNPSVSRHIVAYNSATFSTQRVFHNSDRNTTIPDPIATGRTALQLRTMSTYTSAGFSISSAPWGMTPWYIDDGRKTAELRHNRCGNGVRFTGTETCDDGNLNAGDGCNAFCTGP